MKIIYAAAFLLPSSLIVSSGCATAQHERAPERQSLRAEAETWHAESKLWMSDFVEVSDQFARPLPQLEPDSAFNKHIDALDAHLARLDAPTSDTSAIDSRHRTLEVSHGRLRQAHANMMALVDSRKEGAKTRPEPEFAEDSPR